MPGRRWCRCTPGSSTGDPSWFVRSTERSPRRWGRADSAGRPVVEDFGSRLGAAMAVRGPLCVGIDPHAALLRAWGLSDDVTGLERFARIAVEALADRVAVVKPQSAFFE